MSDIIIQIEGLRIVGFLKLLNDKKEGDLVPLSRVRGKLSIRTTSDIKKIINAVQSNVSLEVTKNLGIFTIITPIRDFCKIVKTKVNGREICVLQLNPKYKFEIEDDFSAKINLKI